MSTTYNYIFFLTTERGVIALPWIRPWLSLTRYFSWNIILDLQPKQCQVHHVTVGTREDLYCTRRKHERSFGSQ